MLRPFCSAPARFAEPTADNGTDQGRFPSPFQSSCRSAGLVANSQFKNGCRARLFSSRRPSSKLRPLLQNDGLPPSAFRRSASHLPTTTRLKQASPVPAASHAVPPASALPISLKTNIAKPGRILPFLLGCPVPRQIFARMCPPTTRMFPEVCPWYPSGQPEKPCRKRPRTFRGLASWPVWRIVQHVGWKRPAKVSLIRVQHRPCRAAHAANHRPTAATSLSLQQPVGHRLPRLKP